MTLFPLVVHSAYYTRGFFPVLRAYDGLVRADDGPITLLLGWEGTPLPGSVNRSAKPNGPAQIHAAGLSDWFQANVGLGDTVQVEFLNPQNIRIVPLDAPLSLPFKPGQLTTHADLAARYGGQQYSGISTPKDTPFVFLFTGEEGGNYGYHDGWDGQEFLYSGEGQKGDMSMTAGNRAILHHLTNCKRLLLFKRHLPKQTAQRYVDEFQCLGYFHRITKDRMGQARQTIVFRLKPVDVTFEPTPDLVVEPTELDQLALATTLKPPVTPPQGNTSPARVQRLTTSYVRDPQVVAFVLGQANGVCQSCANPAPFLTPAGVPFLEVHHVIPLGEGGHDTVDNAVAICPNCHRAAHLGVNALQMRTLLVQVAAQNAAGY